MADHTCNLCGVAIPITIDQCSVCVVADLRGRPNYPPGKSPEELERRVAELEAELREARGGERVQADRADANWNACENAERERDEYAESLGLLFNISGGWGDLKPHVRHRLSHWLATNKAALGEGVQRD